MCVFAMTLIGASSMPTAMAESASGTTTLEQARQQLTSLQSAIADLDTQLQRSEDSMNEALVRQAAIQDDIASQQAAIDAMAPEFAAMVNAQRQTQQWQYTLQFLLADDSSSFIEHMGVTASVWSVYSEQMVRLGNERQRLDNLNQSLSATVTTISGQVSDQRTLLKQQQDKEAEAQALVNTLTAAQRQALGYVTRGVQPQTMHMIDVVSGLFPQIKTIYTMRAGTGSDHCTGLAADFMIPDYKSNVALGWALAHYVQDHSAELGIKYIIYQQSIWNAARPSEGWRHMASRGNDTANHYDHVHVSMKA